MVGSYLLKGTTEIDMPQLVSNESGMVVVKLEHSNVISPYALGISEDSRLLKFGLVSIKLIYFYLMIFWLKINPLNQEGNENIAF